MAMEKLEKTTTKPEATITYNPTQPYDISRFDRVIVDGVTVSVAAFRDIFLAAKSKAEAEWFTMRAWQQGNEAMVERYPSDSLQVPRARGACQCAYPQWEKKADELQPHCRRCGGSIK